MSTYIHQNKPVQIPVPGNKVIEEHFGKIANGMDSFSVAHMQAPPGWSEPAQTPLFDEITIMILGKMEITTEEGVVVLEAGETFFAPKNKMIRYGNPFELASEYWAVCIPAFDPEKARRSE